VVELRHWRMGRTAVVPCTGDTPLSKAA